MAILLPQQFYNLPAGVGKSYYENLAGGTNASATVNNFGPFPVSLVITRVNAPVVTYVVPVNSSLTISAGGVLVFALLANLGGAASGTIQFAVGDL
ncbi:hypothetical protein MHB43_07010 [Paenibacillus sp. FSL H8-0317]|uniref:hypothetical protein n=1 Tax=Paenibacillus TaxID=44249 RepID=UPI000C6D87D2|nr:MULTISPECIES: hypothetical protein [Paenibacillus]MBY0115087.1 hypothetical protein [Paenibacillus xylanexedens]PKQ89950.1 hypothetical protein CXK86_16730 [Paenibacillus sp. BGI2013]